MKTVLFLVLFFIVTFFAFSQNNIYTLLNIEIVINDNFAGQGFTLVYENNNYYIYRRIFGSGVPVVGTIVYNVVFNSIYKITFSEIYTISENLENGYNRNEIFELFLRNDIELYLNGIKISINYIR
jgi:hypothetical protein